MRRTLNTTSISALTLAAALAAPMTAQAATITPDGAGVSWIFDGSNAASCNVSAAQFFIGYTVEDALVSFTRRDFFTPAIADGAGSVIGQSGTQGNVGQTGSFRRLTVGLPTSTTYSGPLSLGIIDSGANSSGNYLVGGTVPLNQMAAEGGSCAVIAASLLPNTAPTANAGANQSVTTVFDGSGTATVTLNGSASSDPDPFDSTLNYQWTQTSGPAVTLAAGSSATDVSPVYEQPAQAGATVFELTVTDSQGATSTDTVTVDWIAQNNAPIADAGANQTINDVVNNTTQITLDGSGSSDPDNDALTYTWTVSGPDAGGVNVFNGTGISSPTTSFTFDFDYANTGRPPQTASVTFSLVVNDGQASSVADSVTYTLNRQNLAPTVSIAARGTSQSTILSAGPGNFDYSAVGNDPENAPLTYLWRQTGGDPLPGVPTSDFRQQNFRARFPGLQFAKPIRYDFEVTASDGVNTSAPASTFTVFAPEEATDRLRVTTARNVRFSGSGTTCNITFPYDIVGGTSDSFDGRSYGADDYTIRARTSSGQPISILQSANQQARVGVIEGFQAIDTSIGTGSNAPNPAQSLIFEIVDSGANGSGSVVFTEVFAFSDLAPNTTAGACASLRASMTSGTSNSLPLADAGQTITANAAPGDVFTLDGTASSDPDGDTLTYRWRQIGGPAATLNNPTSATPTVSATVPSGPAVTYTFELIVNDGTADSAASTVALILTRPNVAPTADAGPDQNVRNVDASTVVTLDGSGSDDPDGDPLTYRWVQRGGSPVTLSDATAARPTFTGFAPTAVETLVFELVVNDGTQDSVADTVSIAVSPSSNFPPVADISGTGSPLRLNGDPATDQIVFLNGRSSSDPDGDALSYQWRQVSGAETLQLSNGTSFTDDFINLVAPSAAGTYLFELTVSDGTETSTATFQIEFTPPNTAPVADAGPNQTLTVASNTVITLDGSASTDGDGDPLTYQWTQTGGTPVTLSDATAAQPTFSYLPGATETLIFQLVVNDGITASAADVVSVELTPGVTAGTVSLAAPVERISSCDISVGFDFTGYTDDGAGNDRYRIAVTSGTSSDATGGASDAQAAVGLTQSTQTRIPLIPNGAVSAPSQPLFASLIDIDASGAVVGILGQTPIDLNAVAAAGPNCRASVKAIRGNQVPVAVAGPDQVINDVDANTLVQLDASASTDADSDTLTYRWVQTAGPAVTLNDPTTATPSFTFVPAMMETITFDVFVSDGTDESQADSVTIKLNRANVLPVAVAGPNQALRMARPGASQTPQQLVLDGSASTDADGDSLTYAWTQVSGPSLTLVAGSSLTDVSPVFEAPAQEGTVVFELVVNDGFGDSPAATVEAVYTFFDNEAPTANAGPDQTVDQAVGLVSVQLSGAGSDPENTALTYSWAQVSGPAVTLSDAAAQNPTFTFDMTGRTTDAVFVFALTTSDGALSSTADEVTVTLTPNAVPVAEAGADQTVPGLTADTIVSLDGSASTDGDGDTLTYRWTQVSGPAVTLSSATAVAPTFSFDPGTDTSDLTFVFDLVVNDGNVDSAPDRVTIEAQPNNAPTSDAGQAVVQPVYVAGTPIQLDGRSSNDPNGDTLSYQWVQLSGPAVTLDNPASATPSFAYDPSDGGPDGPVIFTFGLTVTDGVLQSQQSQVSITLTVNDPPEADAGEDQTVETPNDGATIALDGSGSTDPEGDALTYSWVQTSGRTVTLSDATAIRPTFSYDYPDPLPGEESFTFTLTINDGNQDSLADEVVITVINNQAPTANAGTDIGPVNAGELVTLNGGASTDPDEDTLSYQWTQVSGPNITLSDATAQSPTFTAPDVENLSDLVFELVVNDGRVNSAPDRVTVSVQPVGSIRIVQRVTGSDGAFSYTSDVAALNASIVTQGGLGSLTAERVGTGLYTVTAADARNEGYALTDLSCSDDDSTTDLSGRTATIALAPGEDVVCTFEVVNSREAATSAIRTALVARNQLLLASEPDMQRRMDRLNQRTASAGGARMAGMTVPGSDKLGLTADISERGVNLSGSLLAANENGLFAGQLDKTTKEGRFDVWGELNVMEFDFQGTDGDFAVAYLGADYLVSDTVLVGALVQLDDFDFGRMDAAGGLSGEGYLVGPYATAKFGDNLYVDARAAWGASDNEVNPLGGFTDAFDTSRALYTGTVAGEWTFDNQLNLRPSVSVKYLDETQKAYTDSLGVSIPSQSVGLGELAFGPRVSKPWALKRGWTITPFGEVEGVYNFGDAAKDILQSDTRLRLSWGADLASESGVRIGLAGFNDGIGSDDLESFGLRASISYTMK